MKDIVHPLRHDTLQGQQKHTHAIQEAASRANAHNFISTLQNGYNTHPGERAARISGGQKQRATWRICVGRALYTCLSLHLLPFGNFSLASY